MKQLNRFLFFLLCVTAGMAHAMERPSTAARKLSFISAATPPPSDTPRGVIGYYYNDRNDGNHFTTLVFSRYDTTFCYNWDQGSPDPRLTRDTFSVRWKGMMRVPVTGTYTFNSNADDGFKFMIKDWNGRENDPGKIIINNGNGCCSDFSGMVDLVAGQLYPVEMEFFDGGGGANVMYFKWTAPGIAQAQMPMSNFYAMLPEASARPKITPDRGLFEGSVDVVLTTTTQTGVIHYTLDGTIPTANSPVYHPLTDTIRITKTTTVKASTYAENMYVSEVSTAQLSIIPPILPNPTFTPSAGIYDDPLKMAINVGVAGSTIYYTLDGSTPTTASLLYTDSIHIDSTMRIKAFAVKDGRSPSSVVAATYTILPAGAAAPVFSVAGGAYNSTQQVTITSGTPGAVIRYALNDSALNINSPVYSGPITISATATLRAYAMADGLADSKVTTASYIIGSNEVAVSAPQFSLPGGHYNGVRQVGLFTDTKDALIYYTTDGSVPTENSTGYFALIQVTDSLTINAIAVKAGMKSSEVATATYVVSGAAIDTSLINTNLPSPKLAITPNPASDVARISWSGVTNTRDGYRVIITDSRGAVVNTTLLQDGYTYYILNTSTLADGVYFVKVQSGKSIAKGKLIISR